MQPRANLFVQERDAARRPFKAGAVRVFADAFQYHPHAGLDLFEVHRDASRLARVLIFL
jgi:hypothetical protein